MNLGGPDEWETCVSSQGADVSVGDVFSIDGDETALLSSVALVNPEGVALKSAYVLPATDGYVGADVYPPTIEAWDQRKPVEGTAVAPENLYSFLLVLSPVGTGPHTTDGLIATYEVNGTRHENRNFVGFRIEESCGE